MNRRLVLALLRVAFAALAIYAMAFQWTLAADASTLVPLNFLSYFTIQSNTIGPWCS